MLELQVKGAATLPALPNDRLLMQRLQPSYNVLSNIGRRQGHGQPLYAVTGIQRTAAEGFLQVYCQCSYSLCIECHTAFGWLLARLCLLRVSCMHVDWTHCLMRCTPRSLQNMRQYLTGLTANLAKHTITDVQHEDRVSLLLKDSFIESFAPKERPFVRQFVVRCTVILPVCHHTGCGT